MIPILKYLVPAIISLSFSLSLQPGLQPAVQSEQSGETYLVTKVVDVDTFWIDDGTPRGQKIRLIGVDAPETQNSRTRKKGEMGEEVKDYLTSLILNKKVRLEYDAGRYDRYRRTLAYVYLEDGTFINNHLLEKGYAVLMTYPPNIKHIDLFKETQTRAREASKGLWGKEIE